MYKMIEIIPTLMLLSSFTSCELDRSNPFDEGGYNYKPPSITIDNGSSTVKNNDTIHFDTAIIVLIGNKPQSVFRVKVDTNEWTADWQAAGSFGIGKLADGKHIAHITTMYGGSDSVVSNSISFIVQVIGYKPAFPDIADTVISSDTGKTMTITTTATGAAPLNYAWLKKGTVLPGRTGDTLKFNPFFIHDTTVYQCVASNEYGKDTSRTFTFKFRPPTGGIKGTIADAANNKKLTSVQVTLLPGNKVATTDTIGIFEFKGLSERSYSLAITFTGYSDTTITGVSVNDSETVALPVIALSTAIISKVIYSGNGNDSGTVPVDGNSYKPGMAVTIHGNTGKLTKVGYSFAGWNTTSDATGENYNAGSTFSVPASTDTLYARWTNKPTYSIVYNGNSNTGGTAPATVNFDSGATITIADSGSQFKTGYSFTGWNTLQNGSGTAYIPGDKKVMDTVSITLYAKWMECRYTVTYHGNESTGGTVPLSSNHLFGTKATVANAGDLERIGHTFYRWNTDSTGNGFDYNTGDLIAINGKNVELYARWMKNKYKIAYFGNGNDGGTAPASSEHEYNSTVTVAGKGSLTKTGHSFEGWNRSITEGGTNIAPGSPIIMEASNDTLYAQWKAIQYTVAFNTLGGNNINPVLVNYGAVVPIPTPPAKTSYVFAEWYKDSGGVNKWVFSTDTITGVDTLFAKWVIKDVDGNMYSEVKIGNQVWMTQNLRTSKYNDGTPILLVGDSLSWNNLLISGYCWYDNDSSSYKNTHGALYNWHAVNTGKLAPDGWHVATNADWDLLANYLGGEEIAGGKLKAAGTTSWAPPNTGATNETGFTALPGGRRYPDGKYDFFGRFGYWWAADEYSTNEAFLRYMDCDLTNLVNLYYGKHFGFSIRCTRDW